MSRAEAVVLTLRPLGESRETATLTQRPNPFAPSGQNLMRIGLVADVPDQAIVWGVEDIVESNGELDDAEAGAQVATRYRDRADRLVAQVVGNFLQVFLVDAAKIGRRSDRI